MTDKPQTSSSGASQLMIDLGPIAVFVIAYNVAQRLPQTHDNAIYFATGLFMASILLAIGYSLWKTGRVPPVLIVTGVLVTIFGGLTIAFHDANFIKIKVTIVNLFYATAIFGSLLLGQNVWKLLFRHAFDLPDRIWTILAVRWGCLFLFLALLNEVLRNTQTTEAWVNYRFLPFVIVLLFALLNTPIVLKHTPPENAPDAEQNPPA